MIIQELRYVVDSVFQRVGFAVLVISVDLSYPCATGAV